MSKKYRNKFLIVLLIISIMIPQGLIININTAMAAQTGTVTANTLNVRSKPSKTADIVALADGTKVFLRKDESVTIEKTEGDFYYVSLKFNGKTVKGYVHKDYIKVKAGSATPTPKPTTTPTPKPTATPTPTASKSITKVVELKGTVTASTLNVRSGAGLTYSKVSGLVKGDKVTVINEKNGGGTKWYAISIKKDGKTVKGYVSSAFIKLSYSTSVKGEISSTKLKIRKAAGSNAAYLKNASGTVISLKDGKSVTITGETLISEVKWYQLSFKVSDKKYVGYAQATEVDFKTTVTTPTPTAEPIATPTPEAGATPTPKVSATPTPKVSATPKPTATPTVTPTPSLYVVDNVPIYNYIASPMLGKVCNTLYLNVYDNISNTLVFQTDAMGQTILLQSAQVVKVMQVAYINDNIYYQIGFNINGVEKTGYVQALYIYIDPYASLTPTPTPVPVDSTDFEAFLTQEGFPESYKEPLRTLHALYPNWVFKAYNTGLDWNTVISEESKLGKNLISNKKSYEWLSFVSGAYVWETDKFVGFDGASWVTASQEAIEYYMDPRNFLTTSGIFQFELLKYQSAYQDLAGIQKMLKGTPLDATFTYIDEKGVMKETTYAQTFIEAAEYSGVSPYHLASRVKQEVLTSSGTFSGSASGAYSGYEGYYNFYNIGAVDSASGGAVANGLKYAKEGNATTAADSKYLIPWTDPRRSILGGAYFIGKGYINRGQDTIYLQKFNVTPTSTYYHQYMSNVEAPYAEGKKVLAAYSGMLGDTPIVFSIPVYYNMPSTVAPLPTTMYNPNNRMKSLQVLTTKGKELALTPTFSQTQHGYELIVDNSISSVNIVASAVSSKASVNGGGVVGLNVGSNTFVIAVQAQNGEVSNYILTIVRSEAKASQ